jgi:hypothetical protein
MIPFLTDFRKKAGEVTEGLTRGRVFVGLVVLSLLISSFMLGRLSKVFDEKPVFSLEEIASSENANSKSLEQFQNISTSTIVASKKGKKYYFVWCKYASTIKESNRIYFDNEDKAKASGRALANGCW